MELLSLEINKNENSEIYDNIETITNLDENGINIEIFPIDDLNVRIIYLADKEINRRKYLDIIIGRVTKLLVEYTKEASKLYLEENYFYFDEEEYEEIRSGIEDDITNDIKIQLIIKNKFREVVENSKYININGFIKFRLKFINLYAIQLVEKSIDNYLMKKEYLDFINIIRYLTDVEEKDYNLINVMYNNNKLQVYDNSMKKVNGICTLEASNELDGKIFNYDESVINMLLSISPNKIKLHICNIKKEDKTALNTIDIIKRIFADKVELCSGCKFCQMI